MTFDRRVAVITGAASGIGFALAKICAQHGIHVVMADVVEASLFDKVEQLTSQSQAEILGIICDVSQPQNLKNLAKQTYERFNRVDWLFNNAGISGSFAPIWELSDEQIRKVMDVNLYGVIYGVQAFLPLMLEQKQTAHIINMASLYGLCSGSQMAAYAMSKHGIIALSESLYFDLLRLEKPIDVSVVCPSFVNTQLLSNSSTHEDKLHDMLSQLVERSRPADEVASYIIKEVENKTFYILPDKEVKQYCEERTQAIINEDKPSLHSLEKVVVALSKRAKKTS